MSDRHPSSLLRRLSRNQLHRSELELWQGGDADLLSRDGTVEEQAIGMVAARRMIRVRGAFGLVVGWRFRSRVRMAMPVAAGRAGNFRRRFRALRTRGMIVLRTPAQEGVQQDAEDRQ